MPFLATPPSPSPADPFPHASLAPTLPSCAQLGTHPSELHPAWHPPFRAAQLSDALLHVLALHADVVHAPLCGLQRARNRGLVPIVAAVWHAQQRCGRRAL
eukprot:19118-Chlamydomonas_euryale.AAC.9